MGFPDGSVGKESAWNAGDAGDTDSILGSGSSPGGGNGNPLQYSYLENPTDRGAWKATVHGVPKSQLWLVTRQQPSRKHPVCYLVHRPHSFFSGFRVSGSDFPNISVKTLPLLDAPNHSFHSFHCLI